MIKDEEQLIANLMYRMHANEQARLDAALSSARADAVTRAEADRVRMESVTEELRKEREAHAETAELLNKGDAKVRNMEHTHSVVLSRITIERDSLKDMLDRQTPACNKLILEGHELRAERDALRAEVAALQWRWRMTNEELLSVAEIVERATNRLHRQAAEHEAKMVEHRAAFGVRTEADAKIIEGLRKERDGLLTQVQDMREEIIRVNDAHGRTIVERDALRAEVAALQERLRASIARGDFAQMEVAALKSQTPKHPVKVGEYVKRLTGFNTTLAGEIGKVTRVDDDAAEIEYEVKRPNGETGVWCAKNCEPCEPPEATHAEPDLTQLHAKGKEAWSDVPNATQWVEEMRGNTEATHDTEAGKAAAQNAEKTEQVADEIKVGDLVEVVSNRGSNTWFADVGSFGTVTSVEEINDSILVNLDNVPGKKNALLGCVSFCDVRKVTT